MKSLVKAVARTPLLGTALKSVYEWTLRRSPLAKTGWFGRRRIMDRSSLHAFWRSPAPQGNLPTGYIGPEIFTRSQALVDLMVDIPKGARILEVGCNAGRNMVHLFRSGYRNIEAIEISPHAVQLLRKSFPELIDVPVHVGAAEDILPQFADGHFDLVFTMAVLEHIHPESVEVFDHIARIAKSILAVEPTHFHASTRQYPHDIKSHFERHGFRLVAVRSMEHVPGIKEYSAFRFERTQ